MPRRRACRPYRGPGRDQEAGEITRTYRASSRRVADRLFEDDADVLAGFGLHPLSETWTPGDSWILYLLGIHKLPPRPGSLAVAFTGSSLVADSLPPEPVAPTDWAKVLVPVTLLVSGVIGWPDASGCESVTTSDLRMLLGVMLAGAPAVLLVNRRSPPSIAIGLIPIGSPAFFYGPSFVFRVLCGWL